MSDDPREKLDADGEGLIALGMNGGGFAAYAASRLLDRVRHHPRCSRETQYWMLRSAFARQDKAAIRSFLYYWNLQPTRPSRTVYKFNPGQHYHCLDAKFDTLDEAINHLRREGYEYGGLEEKHVYPEE